MKIRNEYLKSRLEGPETIQEAELARSFEIKESQEEKICKNDEEVEVYDTTDFLKVAG